MKSPIGVQSFWINLSRSMSSPKTYLAEEISSLNDFVFPKKIKPMLLGVETIFVAPEAGILSDSEN